MNYFLFVFIALGIVVALTILSTYNNKHSRIKRQLKQAPRKPIRLVKNGETVQLSGTIEIIRQPIEAPLSGRTCGYYHIIVEREIPHGRRSRYVETFIRKKNAALT